MRSSKPVNRLQAGFTLIELIIVIVIVGIMAAVAIPKYTGITGDAQQASVTGMAGALASASAANYALRTGLGNTKGVAVTDCTDVGALIENLPTDYVITSAAIAADATAACVLTGPGTKTGNFSAQGVL